LANEREIVRPAD